jgi:hypothetical protein
MYRYNVSIWIFLYWSRKVSHRLSNCIYCNLHTFFLLAIRISCKTLGLPAPFLSKMAADCLICILNCEHDLILLGHKIDTFDFIFDGLGQLEWWYGIKFCSLWIGWRGYLWIKIHYKVVEILPETLKTCLFAIVFWICNLRKKKTHLDRSFDCFWYKSKETCFC